jgi:hypothetical protein
LRDRLHALYPFRADADPARRRFAVAGESTQIEFSASLPLAAGASDYYRWRVRTERTRGRSNVLAEWRIDRDGLPADNVGAWQSAELVANIESLEIRYFETRAAASPDSPGQWVSRWRERAKVPALIEIAVRFPKGDTRVWPALVVRPRVTANVTCEYDVVSQRCRD